MILLRDYKCWILNRNIDIYSELEQIENCKMFYNFCLLAAYRKFLWRRKKAKLIICEIALKAIHLAKEPCELHGSLGQQFVQT